MRELRRRLVLPGVVGGVYAGLTILLAPISFGPVQLRVTEILCVLPYFVPETAWGLFLGCGAANLYSAWGILDIVFGSLATLGAGLCAARLGRRRRRRGGGHVTLWDRVAVCLLPALWNGVAIGAVLARTLMPDNFLTGWLLMGGQIALEEAAVLFLGGMPLMTYLAKRPLIYGGRT